MQDLHTHTTFSDGKNSPAEMIEAAIALGLDTIGISDHSYTPFEPEAGMAAENLFAYRSALLEAKEAYGSRIRILAGIEQDLDTPIPARGYDYVIGSVHFLCPRGVYFAVDDTPEKFAQGVKTWFGGDYYAAAESYYDRVSRLPQLTDCTIIGHFDLISKFNEKHHFFDENHPRYVAAWKKALQKLGPRVYEINTGGISRGWRTVPYPAPAMLDAILQMGGKVIFSSDSHTAENLCFGFEKLQQQYSVQVF